VLIRHKRNCLMRRKISTLVRRVAEVAGAEVVVGLVRLAVPGETAVKGAMQSTLLHSQSRNTLEELQFGKFPNHTSTYGFMMNRSAIGLGSATRFLSSWRTSNVRAGTYLTLYSALGRCGIALGSAL